MTIESQVETLEISITQAKKYVDKLNSVMNLLKNKDFNKFIEEGYFKQEASRLVLLKADPAMQKPEDQAAIIRSIDAIGSFRQYISNTIQMGRMMEKSMQEDEVTRDELLMESE